MKTPYQLLIDNELIGEYQTFNLALAEATDRLEGAIFGQGVKIKPVYEQVS